MFRQTISTSNDYVPSACRLEKVSAVKKLRIVRLRWYRCHTMAVIMVTISFPDGSFDNENRDSANSQDFEQFLTNDLMAFRS